jgi:hypothetical protein
MSALYPAAVAALSGEAMRAFYRETLLGAEHVPQPAIFLQ